MFATYDLTHFPYVFIDFGKDLSNDEDFYSFTDAWLRLYEYGTPFILIFNTIQLENVSVKYCFYMSAFIKKIRSMPIQYLQKSFIIVKNKTIMKLLEFVFYMQPPVADVFICDEAIENGDNIPEKIHKVSVVKMIPTTKPYLSFL